MADPQADRGVIDAELAFPFCPMPTDWSLDWTGVVAAFDWLMPLGGCLQEPRWHAEGDVLTHTEMACRSLVSLDSWRSLSPRDRSILFAAVLMHDIGKVGKTRVIDGVLRSWGHARKGAQLARMILWGEKCQSVYPIDFSMREQIVSLIKWHSLPVNFVRRRFQDRDLFKASLSVRCDLLAALAEADVRGRICDDKDESLESVSLFREYAEEKGCLTRPMPFGSDRTRVRYFSGADVSSRDLLFDDCRCDVILMSGLPGAGKDTWIRDNGPSWPVVSLDSIRAKHGISPADSQASVVAEARELARSYLRKGESFIWNATNTTQKIRSIVLRLLNDYKARVRIVYVETPWVELLQRNRTRVKRVPYEVLNKLAEGLDMPDLSESSTLDFIIDG